MRMMRIGTKALVCAMLAATTISGCSSAGDRGQEEQAGSISLQLTGQTNGNTYRLRNALFDVSGPTNTVLDSKVDPNASELHARLSNGDYSIVLDDGWSLERLDGGEFEAVDATLISPNPKSFEILAGEETNVAFQFSTNGQVINIGVGDLTVSLSVVENGNGGGNPEPACDNGMQDGDEEGVDCGGSVCAPCGVSQCNPATHEGCDPIDACYLLDGNGAGQCLPAGSIPIGDPCDGSFINECAGGAACGDLGTGPICLELCDLALQNCSTGLPCSDVGIPNVGACF